MAITPITGTDCKMAWGTAIPGVVGIDFLEESLTSNEVHRDSTGLRGTRTRMANRNRRTGFTPGGSIIMEPNHVEMSTILPHVFGGTVAGTSFPLGETLPAFVVQFLKGAYKWDYTGCKIARATFRGTKSAQLQLSVDILALTEDRPVAAGFPSLTIDETTKCPIFEELVMTVAGETISCFDFMLTLDNGLTPRQVNSVYPTALVPNDRVISWAVNVPAGDHPALFGLADTGVPVVATFTTSATSLALSSPLVAFPRQTPNARGRSEIPMALTGTARGSAALNELACSLDYTPA